MHIQQGSGSLAVMENHTLSLHIHYMHSLNVHYVLYYYINIAVAHKCLNMLFINTECVL